MGPGALASPSPAIVIAPDCLARGGVACFSCRDACGEEAVVFQPAIGGAQPLVVRGACTGCGDCVPLCPVGAITLGTAEAADGG